MSCYVRIVTVAQVNPPVIDAAPVASEREAPEGYVSIDLMACRAGHGIDGRGISQVLLDSLAASTNYLIEKRSLRPALRIGHGSICDGDGEGDQECPGYIVSCRTADTLEGRVLWTECLVREDFADKLTDGTYPMRSIGIDPGADGMGATDLHGLSVGPYLDHIALLGKQGANFPDLAEVSTHSAAAADTDQGRTFLARLGHSLMKAIGQLPARFAAQLSSVGAAVRQAAQEYQMEPLDPAKCEEYGQKCLEAAEALAQISAVMQEMGMYLTGAEPTEPAEPAEGEEPEAEMQNQTRKPVTRTDPAVARALADARHAAGTTFKRLVEGGHATASHRDAFDAMVSAKGLAAAEAHFGSLHVKVPPAPTLPATAATPLDAEYEKDKAFRLSRRLPVLPKDEWMNLMASANARAINNGVAAPSAN